MELRPLNEVSTDAVKSFALEAAMKELWKGFSEGFVAVVEFWTEKPKSLLGEVVTLALLDIFDYCMLEFDILRYMSRLLRVARWTLILRCV